MKIQRDTETEIDKREDEVMEKIITKEIREAVREMKNKKALGPGGISVEFIKHASEYIYRKLELKGKNQIPTELKIGFLTRIHKEDLKIANKL
jgi:hypothetical protein